MIEQEILNKYKCVAMVGASTNPERPSYEVAEYLLGEGYNVIPVNPNAKVILGKACYKDLASIPEKIEIVDIFRRPEEVMSVIEEAIKIGAKAVWMQLGVVNEEAADKARQAGLLVVMDKCMRQEHAGMKRMEIFRRPER
jgi:uncharacterized protein